MKIFNEKPLDLDKNTTIEFLKENYDKLQKVNLKCSDCGRSFTRIVKTLKRLDYNLCNSCGNPWRNKSNKPLTVKEPIKVDLRTQNPKDLFNKGQAISFDCPLCGKPVIGKAGWEKYLCRDCKSKDTKIQKYGSLENAYQSMVSNHRSTVQKHFGVDSFSKTDAFKNRMKNIPTEVRKKASRKARETSIERYGVSVAANTVQNINKRSKFTEVERLQRKEYQKLSTKEKLEFQKKKNMKKYGCEFYTQTDEFKQRAKETKLKNGTWAKTSSGSYYFEGQRFDSSHEVAFYDFCKKQNKKVVYHPNEFFEYEFEGKQHKYWPDFKIDDSFVEIKGDHLWQSMLESNTVGNAKLSCMEKHGVKIYKSSEIEQLVKNVDFYKQYEIKNLIKEDSQKKLFESIYKTQITFDYPNYTKDELLRDWDCLKTSTNGISQSGKKLCRYFHKSFFECSKKGFDSPLGRWTDEKIRKRNLEKILLKYPEKPETDLKKLFNQVCKNPKVNSFQPGFARYLIQKYLKDFETIFDPFSSFSGRLLATVALGKRYIGSDASEKRIQESKNLVDFLNLENVSLVSRKLEDYEKGRKYECLFTCIPYTTENYEGCDENSKKPDDWIDLILEKFDCKKYVIVVDDTIKYKDKIILEKNNTSHYGKGFEKVLIF